MRQKLFAARRGAAQRPCSPSTLPTASSFSLSNMIIVCRYCRLIAGVLSAGRPTDRPADRPNGRADERQRDREAFASGSCWCSNNGPDPRRCPSARSLARSFSSFRPSSRTNRPSSHRSSCCGLPLAHPSVSEPSRCAALRCSSSSPTHGVPRLCQVGTRVVLFSSVFCL